ncbi:hypothetical protein [Kordia sp.]|uniref:hypothetical protein n=1 Tax=Kordia sp. TaxID=1965332 RepID=UPI003D6A31C6
MKKLLFISLLFCFTNLLISQNTTKKVYTLVGEKTEFDSGLLYLFAELITTSDGAITIEGQGAKYEGNLTDFSILTSSEYGFKKKSIFIKYIKERTNIVGEMMGNAMKFSDSSSLEGKTVELKKDNSEWKIRNDSIYNNLELSEIQESMSFIKAGSLPETMEIDFPQRMKLQDTLALNKDSMIAFFNSNAYEAVEGNLVFKEVIERNNESIALFDIDIYIYASIERQDEAYITIRMSGIIERSLKSYSNIKMELEGMLKMEGKLDEEQYLIMEAPAKLTLKKEKL